MVKKAVGSSRRVRVLSRSVARIETLESRRLFAAISFTGQGDGSSWTDSANWNLQRVPLASDDVTIGVGNTIVISAADTFASSIDLRKNLVLTNAASLTITGAGISLATGSNLTVGNGVGTSRLIFTAQDSSDGADVSGSGVINLKPNGQISNQLSQTSGSFPAALQLFVGNLSATGGTLVASDPAAYFRLGGTTNITGPLVASAKVVNDGSLISTGSPQFNGDFTNSGSVSVQAGTFGVGAGGALFNGGGEGSFNVSGGVVTVNGQLVNESQFTVSGGEVALNGPFSNGVSNDFTISGGTATFAGTFANAGLISLSSGLLNIATSFTFSQLGSFSRQGGTLRFTAGTLVGNLALSTSTGSLEVAGGTLQSGTYSATGAAVLIPTNLTLDRYALASDLDASTVSGVITVKGDLTLLGTTIKLGNVAGTTSSILNFVGTDVFQHPVVGGTGTVTFGGSKSNLISNQLVKTPDYLLADAQTVEFDSGVLLNGVKGTIRSTVAGGDYLFGGPIDLSNPGTVLFFDTPFSTTPDNHLTISGATVTFSGAFMTVGGVTLSSGLLNIATDFSFGNFVNFTRTGGTLRFIGGTYTGLLQLTAATGNLEVNGGTLADGTYFTDGTPRLLPTNVFLNNFTFASPLITGPNQSATITGGTVSFSNVFNFATVTVTAGTLAIATDFSFANLGNLTVTAGATVVFGSVTFTGDLPLTNGTGSIVVDGTTLTGGTFTATGGAGLVVLDATFDNYVVAGTVDAATNSAEIDVRNVLTLQNGRILLGDTGGSTHSILAFVGQDNPGGGLLAGTGTVTFGGSPLNQIVNSLTASAGNDDLFATVAGIDAGVVLDGKSGAILSGDIGQTFNLDGNVNISGPGGFFSLAAPFTALGSLTFTGETVTITEAFDIKGALRFSNSVVNIATDFTQANLGSYSTSNSTVTFGGGTLTGNLALSNTTGSLIVDGGILKGGTYSATGSARLIPAVISFDNYTLASNLDAASQPSMINVSNSLTFANASLSLGNAAGTVSSTLAFTGQDIQGGIHIDGTGTIALGGSPANIIINALTDSNTGTNPNGSVVNFAPGVALTGGSALISSSGATASFVFNGPISLTSGNLQFSAPFVSHGGLGVAGGTATFAASFDLDQLTVSSGLVDIQADFTQANLGTILREGGEIVISQGTLTGNLALDVSTGSIVATGGVLKDGTYTATGSARLVPVSVTFDNYVLASDLDAATQISTVYIRNTVTLDNASIFVGDAAGDTSTTVFFQGQDSPGGALLVGNGTVVFGSTAGNQFYNNLFKSGDNADPDALRVTIGSGVTLTGGGATFLAPNAGGDFLLKGNAAVTTPSGFWSFDAPVRIDGTITNSGSTVTFASLENFDKATRTLTGGTFITVGEAVYRFPGDVPVSIETIAANVTLGIPSGFSNGADDSPLIGGNLTITPTGSLTLTSDTLVVSSLNNIGTLSLGPTASIDDSGAFNSTSLLKLAVSGNQAGEFAFISAKNANLAGTISIDLGSFTLPLNSGITLVSTTGLAGTFSAVDINPLPSSPLQISYPANTVLLSSGDLLPPSAPGTPDVSADSDTGVSNSDGYTADNTPTFVGTADSGSIVAILIDGTQVASGTAAGGQYAITVPTLADGVHSVTASSGTLSSASATFTIDTTAPVLTVPTVPPTEVSASQTGTTVTFTASATDALDPNPRLSYTQNSGTFFALGITTVSATATDLAGNVSTLDFDVNVITPPKLGDPDPNFGNGTGTVATTLSQTQITALFSLTLSSGQIFNGAIDSETNQLVLSRFNSDGSLDTTFGSAGLIRSNMPADFVARRVWIEPNSITTYAIGTITSTGQPAFTAFSIDGVFLTSLGVDGIVPINTLQPGDQADTVLQTPDGFLVGGFTNQNDVHAAVVTKITSSGAPNLKFGKLGIFSRAGADGDTFSSLAIGLKGAIFALGTAVQGSVAAGNATSSALLIKLTAAGKLDKSLKQNLYAVPGFPINIGTKVVFQPLDNKVLFSIAIARNADQSAAKLFGTALVRLTAKLALDPTLGGISVLTPPPPLPPVTTGLTITTADLNPATVQDAFDAATSTFIVVPGGRIRALAAQDTGADTVVTQDQRRTDAFELALSKLVFKTTKAVKSNAKLSASVAVNNSGSLASPAGIPISVYLLTTASISSTDVPLVNMTIKAAIKPGALSTVKIPVTAPAGEGRYFLFITINNALTNPSNPTNELSISNDLIAAPPPALLVSNAKKPPIPTFTNRFSTAPVPDDDDLLRRTKDSSITSLLA